MPDTGATTAEPPPIRARWLAATRRWTEPHPAVTATGERRRVRLAAGLLLILLGFGALFLLLYTVPALAQSTVEDAISLGAVALLGVAYGLARSRHAQAAIWLTIAIPWLAIAVMFTTQAEVDHNLLYYGFIPVLLGGVLLRPSRAAAFALFNLLGASTLLLEARSDGAAQLVEDHLSHIIFLAMGSAIVIAGSTILQRSLRETDSANRRLQEADAFRLQLLNTIAHDLNSPLQPIILQLDLTRRGADPQKVLAVVDRNVRHLQRLVADVRDLSKLESGRLVLDRRPVDVAQLVREATEAFTEPAREKQIALDAHAKEPIAAHADPDRLTQVLYNFLTNALKFTPAGGRVVVQATANDGHASVAVSDSGRGLTAEEIPRLFRAFSQVHERHETKEKGTGLGLFISKGIVEGHGGRIWVESEGRGRGSTFRFEFPRTPT